MTSVRPPRPWPENAKPTAEQFAAWLLTCTEPERVDICARLLASQDAASQCFVMNHAAYPEELEALRKQARDAYGNGWRDAIKVVEQRLERQGQTLGQEVERQMVAGLKA